MSRYTQSLNNGSLLPSAYNSLNKIAFTTTDAGYTQLVWYTQFQSGVNFVASIMEMTPATGGLVVRLPNAIQNSVGAAILMINLGTASFQLNDFTGGAVFTFGTTGTTNTVFLWLDDNSTAAGIWRVSPFGTGSTGVNSIGVAITDATTSDNLDVTATPTNPVGPGASGAFIFTFQGDLEAILDAESLSSGSIGLLGKNTDSNWNLFKITGVDNEISVTGGPGTGADLPSNIVIGLPDNVVVISSIKVGNINIGLSSNNTFSPNTISNFSGAGLHLDPLGGNNEVWTDQAFALRSGGSLRFYDTSVAGPYYTSIVAGTMSANIDLFLPIAAPIAGQVLAASTGGQLVWAAAPTVPGSTTANTLAKFVSGGGALGDTPITVIGADMTAVNSITVQSLLIGVTGATTIGTSSGNLIFDPDAGNQVWSLNDTVVRSGFAMLVADSTNTYTYGFQAQAGVGTSTKWTLPLGDGPAGSVMTTSGTGAGSILSFTPVRRAAWTMSGTTVTQIYAIGCTVATSGTPATGSADVTFTTPFGSTSYGMNCTASSFSIPHVGIGAMTAHTTGGCTVVTYNTATNAPEGFTIASAEWFGA